MPESHAVAVAPPEALLLCPKCNAPQAVLAYEAHLHEAHRLIYFRGRLISHDEALALLLNLVAALTPDRDAWPRLARLARVDYGARADAFLAATLGGLFAHVDGKRRAAAVEAWRFSLMEDGGAA